MVSVHHGHKAISGRFDANMFTRILLAYDTANERCFALKLRRFGLGLCVDLDLDAKKLEPNLQLSTGPEAAQLA